MTMAVAADILQSAFAQQVRWNEKLGAPFTARAIALAAAAIDQGPGAYLLGLAGPDPVDGAFALRLAGAFHALALTRRDERLARIYTDRRTADLSVEIIAETLRHHQDFITAFVASPPQTNEIGRSAALLGGFLLLAQRFAMPFRLIEIGASAGLNQAWHRFFYQTPTWSWGDPSSPVQLTPDWVGPSPVLTTARITQSIACDVAPIDIADPDAVLRLRSYVWAEQPARLARLDAAIALARDLGVRVKKADARAFIAQNFAPTPGNLTILFHSVMWNYLSEADRTAISAQLDGQMRAATAQAPLAWLRLEPVAGALAASGDAPSGFVHAVQLDIGAGPDCQIREQILGYSHPHGAQINWRGPI